MGFLIGLLYVLLVGVSVFLCFVILIQDSKSGGLSTAFGGTADTVLGASAQKQISKFTVYVSVVFFVLCITVGILSREISGASRVAEESPPESSTPASLTPGGTANPDAASPGPPNSGGTATPPGPGTEGASEGEKPGDAPDGNGG